MDNIVKLYNNNYFCLYFRKSRDIPFHIPHKKLMERIEFVEKEPEPLVNNYLNIYFCGCSHLINSIDLIIYKFHIFSIYLVFVLLMLK